jgi:hypothetical protein
MTSKNAVLHGLTVALVFCTLAMCARAEEYTFSYDGTGTVSGTVTGEVDLEFIGAGGTGSGAATSLTLTSFPSGLGSFSGGDVATNWADQITNSFTVSAGVLTSFEFYALTAGDDSANELCLNSTGNDGGTFGEYDCLAGLNLLQTNANLYDYNFNGLSGVSFADAGPSPLSGPADTPEPGTLMLLLTGVATLLGATRVRAFGVRARRWPEQLIG